MRRLARLALSVALVVLASCGGGQGDDGGSGRPSSTGRIEVLEPQPGEVVPADDVTVRVRLTGAKLVEQATTDIQPDEGHMHLKVDGETITLLGGLEETVPGLTPGVHLLEVEFAAGDHGPFDPRVFQTVSFTVE